MTDVEWWGILTRENHTPERDRRQRMAHLERAARAHGVLSAVDHDDDGPVSITLRWSAAPDLSSAAARILDIAGVAASDFARGPERLDPIDWTFEDHHVGALTYIPGTASYRVDVELPNGSTGSVIVGVGLAEQRAQIAAGLNQQVVAVGLDSIVARLGAGTMTL
jgi:hypothetical protein